MRQNINKLKYISKVVFLKIPSSSNGRLDISGQTFAEKNWKMGKYKTSVWRNHKCKQSSTEKTRSQEKDYQREWEPNLL